MSRSNKKDMKEKEMKSSEENKQKGEETQTQEQENQATEDKTQEQEETTEVSETEQLENELAQQKDKYLRLYSDFENFRRRNAKERLELHKTANEDVLTDLLPIIDDFERAIQAAQEQEGADALKEGVDLVYNKLVRTLNQKGLEVMEIKKGDNFDPDFHEAITQIPVEDDKLKGKIVDVIEKGYMLGEKVIRFAKVVTGA